MVVHSLRLADLMFWLICQLSRGLQKSLLIQNRWKIWRLSCSVLLKMHFHPLWPMRTYSLIFSPVWICLTMEKALWKLRRLVLRRCYVRPGFSWHPVSIRTCPIPELQISPEFSGFPYLMKSWWSLLRQTIWPVRPCLRLLIIWLRIREVRGWFIPFASNGWSCGPLIRLHLLSNCILLITHYWIIICQLRPRLILATWSKKICRLIIWSTPTSPFLTSDWLSTMGLMEWSGRKCERFLLALKFPVVVFSPWEVS